MTTAAASAVPVLMADRDAHAPLVDFVAARAADVDANRASVREGLAFVARLGLIDLGLPVGDRRTELPRMAEVIATIAQHDMAQAFSLWCHRMAIEYLALTADRSPFASAVLPELISAKWLGSSAFAAGTAHYLAGTPLPVSFQEAGGGLRLNGRIPWASNLAAPFVSVTAAVSDADPAERVVVAFTDATAGLQPPSYPDLVALQATASCSPTFEDAEVPESAVLTRDFEGFVRAALPTFLVLQCSFCWGLASRALAQAEPLLEGQRVVLGEDFVVLQSRFALAERGLRESAAADRDAVPTRRLLELRLEWGRLAVESVALEAKLVGGRGYMIGSDTARRLREAAFLPIQAPTEVQLRWLLSRSA